MDIAINDVGQLRKSLKVVVSTKEISEKYQEKYQYIQENIRVKGFRPGHIPANVIARKYGDAISNEVKAEILQEALSSIEEKNALKIMGEPQFKEEKPFKLDSDWSFEFTIDIQPQFELPTYKQMEVKKTEVQISEEEITSRIDTIRRSKGTLIVVENEATQEEDHLVCDLCITIGDAKIYEKANYNIEVKNTEVFGLSIGKDLLIGKKVGETVEATLPIPETYEVAEHRGKDAKFTCKVLEIKRMKLADLNDGFAKEIGCENVEDLKNKLREQMKIEKEMHVEMQVEDELLEKLLKDLKVTLPEEFIKDRLEHAKKDFFHHQKEHEKKEDSVIEEEWKKEEEKANIQWRERITEYFLINRISEIENVEVTEQDLEEHFRQVAWQFRRWPNEIRSQYEKMGMMDEVKYDIKKRKVMVILRENAKYV